MKLFLSLLSLSIATQTCPEIEEKNQELLLHIQSLRKQLQGFSSDPEEIMQDLTSNKEKLNALIREYSQNSDELYLAEDIKHYLLMISEDLKVLNTLPENISVEIVETTLSELSEAIHIAKVYESNKEFSRTYNKILSKLDQAHDNINNLVSENALLLGKLENSKAEYQNLMNTYQNEQNYRLIAENELSRLKIDHSNRIEIIEKAITHEEKQSRQKEIENFRQIQESQNILISQLQTQNSEQALRIEQLGTSLSNALNTLNASKNTIENLEQELKSRNTQLLDSESNFDEFRNKIELENNGQLSSIRSSQE